MTRLSLGSDLFEQLGKEKTHAHLINLIESSIDFSQIEMKFHYSNWIMPSMGFSLSVRLVGTCTNSINSVQCFFERSCAYVLVMNVHDHSMIVRNFYFEPKVRDIGIYGTGGENFMRYFGNFVRSNTSSSSVMSFHCFLPLDLRWNEHLYDSFCR